ncbi:MAG: hypothetical protein DRO67_00590 [Candidatus Asgardarchaeum californiense]|nr:MAG: hypothetical protein DRO67_00590 [Candidatus Asgardarchaeum californiense]
MSLKSVYEKLEHIANLSSTLDKREYLKTALQDKLFLKTVQYALDPTKKYHIKRFPKEPQMFILKDHLKGPSNLFSYLDTLSNQRGASNIDKDFLYQLASIDKETYEVVKRICKGDLRCGVGVRILNQVRPNTIPFTPYLRCSTRRHINNIVYPAIVQEKANGMYAEMRIDNGKITFGTRDSKKIKKLKHLKEVFWNCSASEHEEFNNIVLMGELRVYDKHGNVLDRQTGNGIINQCIQGTVNKKKAKRVFFTMWDAVPLEDYLNEKCSIPYYSRFNTVEMFCKSCACDYYFQPIRNMIVHSEKDAQYYANDIIELGGEGAVLKNVRATWKHGTSLEQIKLKALYEAELRILSWDYGDKGKKHETVMGRITVGTDCGGLVCSIGGGFSDELRADNWDNNIGRICEIEYQDVSESKSRKDGVKSLYGPPVFVCFRDDKDKPDTLEDILNR